MTKKERENPLTDEAREVLMKRSEALEGNNPEEYEQLNIQFRNVKAKNKRERDAKLARDENLRSSGALSVTCGKPRCGVENHYEPHQRGKTMMCKNCKKTIRIPKDPANTMKKPKKKCHAKQLD